MMEIIALALAASLVFGALYVRYLIKQVRDISRDFLLVRGMIAEYGEELKAIYETEMFYGEPVLQSLVEQTKVLTEQLDAIIEDYDYEELNSLVNSEESINEEA